MNQIILSGHYDWRLVILSIATAVYASYAAFGLAGKISSSQGKKQALWIGGGALAMGLGMWAMHYIGMLGFILPVPVLFNVPIVLFSLLVATVSCGVALFVVSRKHLSEVYLVGGSVAMGGGIAAMHYSAMAAMRLAAEPIYNIGFVSLSVVIAVVASGAALQLARLRNEVRNPGAMRLACAGVMGFAMCATHYVGVAAVSFRFSQAIPHGGNAVSAPGLSIAGIALLTAAVLALSLLGSRVDQRYSIQRLMLETEQERWLLVMSASLDGLFDMDLVTGQVFYSPRYKAIIGYEPSELDTSIDTWQRLIYPGDLAQVEQHLQEYLGSGRGGAAEIEYRVGHRDGSLRWIHVRSQAVWDASGKAIRVVGSCSDITDRKRAEERLGASETKYRQLFDGNPLPGWIYSPANLEIMDVNQAALDYYGWSREEFVGMSVNSIRMPGDEEQNAGQPADTKALGKPRPWRLRRKNKSGIWVELSNHEIEIAGAPARLMLANDVTAHVAYTTQVEKAKEQLQNLMDQKAAELKTKDEELRTLAEALPQFVWATRPDGSCDYMGHQWAEYCGIPATELLGSQWLETVHPEDRDKVEGCWQSVPAIGGSYEVQFRVRGQDSSYQRFVGRARPVRTSADTTVTRWLWTAARTEDPSSLQALNEKVGGATLEAPLVIPIEPATP